LPQQLKPYQNNMNESNPMTDTLKAILAQLNLTEAPPLWEMGWGDSQQTYPQADLPFLAPAFIQQQAQAINLDEEIVQALLTGLPLFERQPGLKRLLWHLHYHLFGAAPARPEWLAGWPRLSRELDQAAPLFYLYLYLSGVPSLLAYHRQLGIPTEITVDTLSDLEVWTKYYRHTQGEWGFVQFGWLWAHFSGRLYKLGRLQFELTEYDDTFHIFQQRETGRVIVLAKEGLRFRQDGLFDGTNGVNDPQAWTTTFQQTPKCISGYPIDPLGLARTTPLELPAADWIEALQPGDTVLGVHIAATGPMDFAACGESFAAALPFFQQYFPQHQVNAFTCHSWLLDYQLAEHLPAESNIVRFLRQWYLLPHPRTDSREIVSRVFHTESLEALDSLPQHTTLQQAIVSHLQRGGHWRGGIGLIFPHSLKWGGQVYQSGHVEA
jgi:hypothetical protein